MQAERARADGSQVPSAVGQGASGQLAGRQPCCQHGEGKAQGAALSAFLLCCPFCLMPLLPFPLDAFPAFFTLLPVYIAALLLLVSPYSTIAVSETGPGLT